MTLAKFAEFKVAVAVAVGATTDEVSVCEPVLAAPVPFWVVKPLFTLTLNVPDEPVPVGVPLITPVVVLSESPAGKEPVSAKVNGPVPVVGSV